MIIFDDVSFTYPETDNPVFKHLSLELPDGIVSFVGQNATGKSTLLLLAGGRLLPDRGTVLIDEQDTKSFKTEEARAEYAAHIYQNMEFETDEKVRGLLSFVYENGFHTKKDFSFIDELTEVFELRRCLDLSTGRLSKGELQRVILAFSLLYGSSHVLMDEPVFALEDYQKQRSFSYLKKFSGQHGVNILYSVHELDLSEKFSDYLLLFSKTTPPRLGKTKELFRKEVIEEAYEVPIDALKRREAIFRDALKRIDDARRQPHSKERKDADKEDA